MNCKNQLVDITKFVNGGYGLARCDDGNALFTRFGLPGERVTVSVSEHRKKAAFGHVIAVRKPHPGRIDPPCPYYGKCGGCDLQHVAYTVQQELKQQVIAELVASSANDTVRAAASRIRTIRQSDQQFHYRQRIRLAVDRQGIVGFKHFRSGLVVPVKSCLLAAAPINRCLEQALANASFHRLTSISEQVEISLNPLDDSVSVLFSLHRPPRPADRKNAEALNRDIAELDRVFFRGQQFALEGPCTGSDGARHRYIGFNLDTARPLTLKWEIGGFSQVNIGQNRSMIDLVTRLARPGPGDRLLDLYCGMGNFSVPLALLVADVYGVEAQGSAIRSAKRNCTDNEIANCRFEKSDVESACTKLAAEKQSFDIVICDPPRRGIPGLATPLASLTAGRMIYVSCDPATLCRDLDALADHGLRIVSIHPVDMFPQTHHIETVVALEKTAQR